MTELRLSSLWKTSKSFTFAESHFEINIWEGWREVFPYLILTLGVPFGLLAAAFVMTSRVFSLHSCLSHLRMEPLRGEWVKIFHYLNLCHEGTSGGFLEVSWSTLSFMIPMTFPIRLLESDRLHCCKLPKHKHTHPPVVRYCRPIFYIIIKHNTELTSNLAKLHFSSSFFSISTVSVLWSCILSANLEPCVLEECCW